MTEQTESKKDRNERRRWERETKRFSLPSNRLLQFGTEQEVSEEKNMA